MEKQKSVGFGTRGTILIIYQMLAYVTYCAFTNYPQNVLSEFYGGMQHLTFLTMIAGLAVFVIQYFFIAPNVGKIKSFKKMIIVLAPVNFLFILGIMLFGPDRGFLWDVSFTAVSILTQLYVTFCGGMLIGNWFPRRKGTVMGIVTMTFPIVTGILLGAFTASFYRSVGPVLASDPASIPSAVQRASFGAFLPFAVVTVISYLIAVFFVKDFPEQCGAFRDNDRGFTAEMANRMLLEEIELRKKSVWKRSEIWKCRDWWFMAIPSALLLSLAIAFMVQIIPVLQGFPEIGGSYVIVLTFLSIAACAGSWGLGIVDTKFGTKTALIVTSVLMLLAGILGATGRVVPTVTAAMLLGLFMGASSNFGLSAIVRYWRREDFPAVYAGQPPLGFIISSVAPFAVASIAAAASYSAAFLFVAVMAVVCLILLFLFNPRNIIRQDDKLREAAGLPLDGKLAAKFDEEKKRQ